MFGANSLPEPPVADKDAILDNPGSSLFVIHCSNGFVDSSFTGYHLKYVGILECLLVVARCKSTIGIDIFYGIFDIHALQMVVFYYLLFYYL